MIYIATSLIITCLERKQNKLIGIVACLVGLKGMDYAEKKGHEKPKIAH